MRIIIQRVTQASVEISKVKTSEINKGLLLLVAFEDNDNQTDIDWMIKKILGMRIFSDSNQKMNLSVDDIQGAILIVSQFTLYASTKKGNRPSFIKSATPFKALDLYNQFVKSFQSITSLIIQTGTFGADMKITSINDGPVTVIIDSKIRE
tara:strand:- start:57 stop:509 length:453 start_codon:yes stop_codon:yes gene_type:complete